MDQLLLAGCVFMRILAITKMVMSIHWKTIHITSMVICGLVPSIVFVLEIVNSFDHSTLINVGTLFIFLVHGNASLLEYACGKQWFMCALLMQTLYCNYLM